MLDDFSLTAREPFDPFSVMLFKALQVVAFLSLSPFGDRAPSERG
jgi:hypothetical protein